MKVYKTIMLLFTIGIGFAVSMPVFAATLSVVSNNQKLSQGQDLTASVFLNTNNDPINALQGHITFPGTVLSVQAIQEGDSIVNFWVTQPKVAAAGGIDFSGIIPGGYNGAKGFLFSITFKAKAAASGDIGISNVAALENDGNATPADVAISPLSFSVDQQVVTNPQEIQPVKSSILPDEFTPLISRSPNLFDGKWFLVFATQDKGSSIDHYEVSEGSSDNFKIAQSPYLLADQNLDQEIFVKAVDKSGNERMAVFHPPNGKPWYKKYLIVMVLIVLALLILGDFITGKLLWQRQKV